MKCSFSQQLTYYQRLGVHEGRHEHAHLKQQQVHQRVGALTRQGEGAAVRDVIQLVLFSRNPMQL